MLLAALILSSLLPQKFALRFYRGLTSGSILIFQVALYICCHAVIASYYLFLCLGILLAISSRWLLPRRYYRPIRGFPTSIFMAFGTDLHTISAINGIHHFISIPLNGSFYMQSWLAIMALLAMGPSSLILYAPPNIVPWILIRSLICCLLSTGRLIGSNLMPPVPNFRLFSLMMTPFMGSTIALMVVFTLFRVIQ